MNNILKIERALAFAKELNLTDEQVKELMAMVLGLVNFKFNTTPSTPIVPWQPQPFPSWPNGIGTGGPIYPGDTIITYGVAPAPTSVDVVKAMNGIMGSSFFGLNTQGCACSPVGQPHHDNCKAG